ncbi:ACP S-malonyltransferase [Holzapfeliella floricola]|uniref:Malonyl CoA-acyl carrier protein transacylase n=1 Tax=Holzapfeliella floricola DSM 23037 = JCM 16512 TaxID=1423744 RepID=A0A0R2DIW5_9LACO|nr:ACP S-malonyltransferase [Holzapfeliella floricola]KRN04032.1 (acyl-carrier-protein) S-malonyltransferase [Holzapfeliella floricola DSM 23037 = JCM 16512]
MNFSYLFAGQGQQSKGMGQDLYEAEPLYRQTIEEASKALDLDLTNPEIFDAEENTQVAIVAMSLGIFRILNHEFGQASSYIGLSLGEYSALLAANSLDFGQGFPLLSDRMHYMQEAGENNPGKMMAVLNCDAELLQEVLTEVNQTDAAYPANYNTPDQTVIGGSASGLKQVKKTLKEHGIKKAIPLKMSVASHTPLMQEASDKLAKRLESVDFKTPDVPVMSNTTVTSFDLSTIKQTLTDQLVQPTHFYQGLEKLVEMDDLSAVIEIGPGQTLSRFAKKTCPKLETYAVHDLESLNQLRQKWTK